MSKKVQITGKFGHIAPGVNVIEIKVGNRKFYGTRQTPGMPINPEEGDSVTFVAKKLNVVRVVSS